MQNTKHNIRILKAGQIQDAILTVANYSIEYNDGLLCEKVEGDYPIFSLLRQLRKRLEEYDILLLIAGNRIDVWPSGMQSSMNTGSAYIVEMGKAGGEVIGILEAVTDITQLATVNEQGQYHKDWLASIGINFNKK